MTRMCARCNVGFPTDRIYESCPACGAVTKMIAAASPSEGWRNHIFEAYYQRRHGPAEEIPEEVGRAEARRELAQLRELEALWTAS